MDVRRGLGDGYILVSSWNIGIEFIDSTFIQEFRLKSFIGWSREALDEFLLLLSPLFLSPLGFLLGPLLFNLLHCGFLLNV